MRVRESFWSRLRELFAIRRRYAHLRKDIAQIKEEFHESLEYREFAFWYSECARLRRLVADAWVNRPEDFLRMAQQYALARKRFMDLARKFEAPLWE